MNQPKKTFKEILKETNREFSQEFRTWLPIIGDIIAILVWIVILFSSFSFHPLLGVVMIPVSAIGAFWCVRLINNIHYWWKS